MKRIFISLIALSAILSVYADYTGIIYTPNGTAMTVTYYDEYDAEYLAYLESNTVEAYPQATMVGGATHYYNQHAYAWYMTDNGHNCWINDSDVSKFWSDGSFVSVSSISDATRIYYPSVAFSAMKISASVFRSKWHAGPLMDHAPAYGPYPTMGSYNMYAKAGTVSGGGSTSEPTLQTGSLSCSPSYDPFPLNGYHTFSNATYTSTTYTYTWSAETSKGDDDAIAKGGLSLSVNSNKYSATVSFLKAGIYVIYLRVYTSDGTLIGEFSYEATAGGDTEDIESINLGESVAF